MARLMVMVMLCLLLSVSITPIHSVHVRGKMGRIMRQQQQSIMNDPETATTTPSTEGSDGSSGVASDPVTDSAAVAGVPQTEKAALNKEATDAVKAADIQQETSGKDNDEKNAEDDAKTETEEKEAEKPNGDKENDGGGALIKNLQAPLPEAFMAMSFLLEHNKYDLAKSYVTHAPSGLLDAIIDSVMICLRERGRAAPFVSTLIKDEAEAVPEVKKLLPRFFQTPVALAWRNLVGMEGPQSALDTMLPQELFNAVKNPKSFPFGELVPAETADPEAPPAPPIPVPQAKEVEEDNGKTEEESDKTDPHKEFLDLLTKSIRQIMITDLDNDIRIVLADINKYFEERGAVGPPPGGEGEKKKEEETTSSSGDNATPAPEAQQSQQEETDAETEEQTEKFIQLSNTVYETPDEDDTPTGKEAVKEGENAVQQQQAAEKAKVTEEKKTEKQETGVPLPPVDPKQEEKLEAKDSVLVMAEFVINRYIIPRLVPLLYAESQTSNEQHGIILVAEALRHLARLELFKKDGEEAFMEFTNPWIKENAKPLAEWLIKQATMKTEKEKPSSPGLPDKEDALVTLVHSGLIIHPDVLIQATESAVPGPFKRLSEVFTSVFDYIGPKYHIYPAEELSKMSGHLKEFKKHYVSVAPHSVCFYGDVRAGPANYKDSALFLDDADSFEETLRGRFGYNNKVKLQWDVKDIKSSFAITVDAAKVATTKIKNFKKAFPDTKDGSGVYCFTVEPLDGKVYIVCGRASMARNVYCGIAFNAGLMAKPDANTPFWMCLDEKNRWDEQYQDLKEKSNELKEIMASSTMTKHP